MFIGACLFGYYKLTQQAPPLLVDNVVPYFIVNNMPAGIVGLILAAILAASMSSVSGDLNSIATVLTRDYLNYLRPEASDKFQLVFGRLMVAVAGAVTMLIAILLIPEQGLASVMERAVTIAAILSGGMLGLFFLGFLTRKATRTGCYIGIVSCLLFTAWALLTEPKNHLVDLPLNFGLNPILIGVLSHIVLFGIGYVASLIFGGYCPEDVERLTIYGRVRNDSGET